MSQTFSCPVFVFNLLILFKIFVVHVAFDDVVDILIVVVAAAGAFSSYLIPCKLETSLT